MDKYIEKLEELLGITEKEDSEKLSKLIDTCDTLNLGITSPFCFFDKKSDKNISKKVLVLEKLIVGGLSELTEEEARDKSVFEKIPDNVDRIIIN